VALLSGQRGTVAGARWFRRFPLLFVLLCASAAHGQPQASETDLKSAFLFKFVHYAEWPPEALGALGNPIAMCVIGADDLASALEGAVRGRTSHERPVVVRRLTSADEVGGCHVLFVGWPEDARTDQMIERASAQPTLTVGDAEGFARRGGMINFTRQGTRLGFEINRGAVLRAGLDLSSQLLKLAKLVPEERGGD
jgi:hypothetical protein